MILRSCMRSATPRWRQHSVASTEAASGSVPALLSDFTYAEIAEAVGIAEGTVAATCRRLMPLC